MNKITQLYQPIQQILNKVDFASGIAPLLFRIYLAPIMIIAGYNKLSGFEGTVYWFGEYLGLPAPGLMASLAIAAELGGGILLLLGLATRLVVIPLMVTMVVAAVTAHWQFGWHVLPETTLTMPWEWRMDLIEGADERKAAAKSLLQQHGNYSWLTETGAFTILKNGIEMAATYFIMLLSLFFTGGGRYTSLDYYLVKSFLKSN